MVRKMITNNESGFSIIEVMIAMALFLSFSLGIIFSQSGSIDRSDRFKKDLILNNLAVLKMNESLVDVKKFTNATEKDTDSGKFDIEGFKNYKFLVEYKKNKFPDFSSLIGKTEEEENRSGADPQAAIKKAIFEKLKKNMETMLWQIKVTVTNPETKTSTELTSWVTNREAQIDTNFAF